MSKKKYKEISVDTAIEIRFKNSDGEHYKRETLMVDKRRFFLKKSSRNNFKKSENLKISEEKYEELLKNYREKGLKKAIENYDIEKSQSSQKLSDLRDKINEKERNLSYLKNEISEKFKELDDLTAKIKSKEEKIQERENFLQKVKDTIEVFKNNYFKSKDTSETEEKKSNVLKNRRKTLNKEIKILEDEKKDLDDKIEIAKTKKEELKNDYFLYNQKSNDLFLLKLEINEKKAKLKSISLLTTIKQSIYFLILPVFLIFLIIFLTNLKYNFFSNY